MLQVLWMGQVAMQAALELLHVAQTFESRTNPDAEPLSWPQPFLRPAANAKQARDFSKLHSAMLEAAKATQKPQAESGRRSGIIEAPSAQARSAGEERGERGAPSGCSVSVLSLQEAAQKVPGLPRERLSGLLGPDLSSSAALLVEGAHVLHPSRYLRSASFNLWRASVLQDYRKRPVGIPLRGAEASQMEQEPLLSSCRPSKSSASASQQLHELCCSVCVQRSGTPDTGGRSMHAALCGAHARRQAR